MGFVTVVLGTLGLLVLILGWRWQNQPGNEIIAALKGIAQLKRQIERLRDDLYALEERVIQHEQTYDGKKWEVEQRFTEIREKEERVLQALAAAQAQLDELTRAGEKYAVTTARTVERFASAFNPCFESVASVPEKYRNVLELDQFGMTISEIAGRLGISQDAVGMVLRTYHRERTGYEN